MLAAGLSYQPDDARVALRSVWETFQVEGEIHGSIRPEIAASWRRSAELEVTSELPAAPMDEAALRGFDAAGQVRRQFVAAARKLADHLAGELHGTNSAVVVCDDGGVLLYRTGARDILRRTDRLNLVPGGVWEEGRAGTNGIGLALALGDTTHVSSAEHYCEAFQDFSCIASPVRHPVTREVLGVLDLTTDMSGADCFAPALVTRAAREVERLMEEQVFGRERELLERYLHGRAGHQSPVLTVDRSGHTIIQNARMLQTASAEDVELLLGIARSALRREQDHSEELELSRGRAVVAAHMVRSGPEVIGALVSFERAARRRSSSPLSTRPQEDWSPLVGRSPAMQVLFRQAGRVARRRAPVVVRGEPGTGKLTLAKAMHRVSGTTGECVVVHCARPGWREEWAAAKDHAATIVLRRVHALDPAAQLELADEIDALDDAVAKPWLIGLLSERAEPPAPELLHRLAQITLSVPPLRDREHDLELIVSAWCRRSSGDGPGAVVVRREALEALAARDWPGNVRELINTLEAAMLRGGSVIGVDALELPASPRSGGRAAAGALHEVEKDAIVSALARNGGNVTRTARELGIGRATLHRRLRAYRLMSDARD